MRLTVLDTEQAFYNEAAWRLATQMAAEPRAVIGFSTGRTTGGIHAALAALHRAHPFDVSGVTAFGLDEITGIRREDPCSCYDMLLREVVQPLGISLENFLMPPVQSDDFAGECAAYLNAIDARGPVSLLMLGLGENGHLGFNQPGAPFGATCWISRMDAQLDARIRREVGAAPDAELGGFTLGIRDIMRCKRLVLVANGARKSQVVRDALNGPVTEALPASVLQLHPDCEWILDAEAAQQL